MKLTDLSLLHKMVRQELCYKTPESYDKTQQALALLKLVSHSEQQIESGHSKTQEKVFSKISRLLDEKSKI